MKALSDQLKKYKSNIRLYFGNLQDDISAVTLRDGKNVDKWILMIKEYENKVKLLVGSLTSTILKFEHSNYLILGDYMYNSLKFFSSLIYDKIVTLVYKQKKTVMKIKAHKVSIQKEDNLVVAVMFSRLWMKSEKPYSK